MRLLGSFGVLSIEGLVDYVLRAAVEVVEDVHLNLVVGEVIELGKSFQLLRVVENIVERFLQFEVHRRVLLCAHEVGQVGIELGRHLDIFLAHLK